ncbi:MAG TPA: histidine kinase [Thermoanaerobaculia bacterium]|nr:histidine kinase [Thermoanaerobaculia bacterium]
MRRFALVLLVFVACRKTPMAARFGGDVQSIEVVRVDGRERTIYSLPRPPATFRIEKDVELRGESALYVSILAPFEVWWDGKPIGRGGAIDNVFVLDASQRAAGTHRLSIRVEAGREAARVSTYCYGIVVGPANTLLRRPLLASLPAIGGLGLFIVTGIYFIALWAVGGRRRSVLLLAMLCFATSLLVAAETSRWVIGYPFAWHLVRLRSIVALTYVVSLLLPLFFVVDLALPRPRVWAAALAAALWVAAAVPRAYDWKCLAMFWCASAGSALAIGIAARRGPKRLTGAIGGVAAIIAALAAAGYEFGDGTFSVAFMILILCLLASMAFQLRDERREHAEARLRAARLEIELLKKTFQPHFLMNTLTAVIEWIEFNPSEGVRFLEALALELRILTQIAGETSIAASRELELCRSHLAIMSCRKGTRFELASSGVDARTPVPPAIFHTLLENAITHNEYRGEQVTFTIRGEREGDAQRYVIDAPLGRRARRDGEGTGLRYIRARLEESFPGNWRMESAEVEGSWRTTILVPCAS